MIHSNWCHVGTVSAGNACTDWLWNTSGQTGALVWISSFQKVQGGQKEKMQSLSQGCIPHVHVKHLHQSVGRNCRGPEWAASNYEELKSGWSEFTAHQGSSQSKESTQRFQRLLERTHFSPPPPSTPPPLYYVTSAVVSIKNTVVLFSKLMKLLTLVFNHHPSPSLFRSPGMLEGSVSCQGLSLVVDTKGKKKTHL